MKESKIRVDLREAHVFERDLPYTKDQIWNEGKVEEHDEKANAEIYRVFGHDVATYPNQDNPQHFANVQFAGDVSNNKLHVMQDHQASRTSINHALRAVTETQEGRFARDGEYSRAALWTPEVEKQGVERTARGLRQDLDQFLSRDNHNEHGVEFEHQAGYLKSDIFGHKEPAEPKKEEPAKPETPKAEPKKEEPCTNCEPGTLGNALASAEAAAGKLDKVIAPVKPTSTETAETPATSTEGVESTEGEHHA